MYNNISNYISIHRREHIWYNHCSLRVGKQILNFFYLTLIVLGPRIVLSPTREEEQINCVISLKFSKTLGILNQKYIHKIDDLC